MNSIAKTQKISLTAQSQWTLLLLKLLGSIEVGELFVSTPEGERFHFRGRKPGQSVSLQINSWDIARKLFLSGDIGLGESYIDGDWDCEHIHKLTHLGIDNYAPLKRVIAGSLPKIIFSRLKHKFFNRNTVEGSRRNIHAHYDLGNDFYKLWLDSSMTYSSALFKNPSDSLPLAQLNKYKAIFSALNLRPGDHVLEVGCGWGGFMEFAASRGVKVTGITISNEQYEFATQRLAPYADIAKVELRDYRHIEGVYDHIVSIEMFEALGEEYWDTYFKTLEKSLKPGGSALIQSITIRDKDFNSYRRGADFIQAYIFPGGMLPSVSKFLEYSSKNNFMLTSQRDFGIDYAKTLSFWDETFLSKRDEVKQLGFDSRFMRTWHFYLQYCQGGFEARKIGVAQFKLEKGA